MAGNRRQSRAARLADRAAQPGGPRRAARLAARVAARPVPWADVPEPDAPLAPRCNRIAERVAARAAARFARAAAYYADRTAAAYLQDYAACTPPRDRAWRAATIAAGYARRVATGRAQLHRGAHCAGQWEEA